MSSWFSRTTLAPLRYNQFAFPAVGPEPFNPSKDVSGLAFWLDADDSSTLDISGTDVLTWTEKLKGVDVYNTSDLSNCPQYGVHFFNQRNVVYFPLNAMMLDSETVLDFNDRTCFVVAKPLAFQVDLDISGSAFLNFYHGDATADMSLGLRWFDLSGITQYSICSKDSVCGVQFDISENPLKTKMILAWRQSSSDLSGNAGWYDTISQTLANSQLSSFNPDGQYKLSDDTKNQSVDIAEILIYDSVLKDSDVVEVLDYLAAKWGAARPPKPKPIPPTPIPPGPFSPKDISGLYIWMDANDQLSVTVDGSNHVLSWSNNGIAANVFSNDSNFASYVQDSNNKYIVSMPSETTLTTTATLPYLTRTAFAVFENKSDMTLLTYPYTNLWNTGTQGGVQLGVSYDSNTSNYAMTLCQQGLNCPAAGVIPALSLGNYNLAIWACDSTTTASNYCSFNGGSNLNTSTDLGNLFNTSNISYEMGSPVSGSPEYRIGEILEYDSYLTTAQVSTVADYLVQKWAISSFTTLV